MHSHINDKADECQYFGGSSQVTYLENGITDVNLRYIGNAKEPFALLNARGSPKIIASMVLVNRYGIMWDNQVTVRLMSFDYRLVARIKK